MSSGKEKWWSLGALGLAALIGIVGIAFILGGVAVYSLAPPSVEQKVVTKIVTHTSSSSVQAAPLETAPAPAPTEKNEVVQSGDAAVVDTSAAAVAEVKAGSPADLTAKHDQVNQAAVEAANAGDRLTPAATTAAQPATGEAKPAAASTAQPAVTPTQAKQSIEGGVMGPDEAMNKLLTPEQQKEADDVIASLEGVDVTKMDYETARWHPIHNKPAIYKASDAVCLKCHQEVLDSRVRTESPAGLKTENTLAWYQTLDTYEGDQQTFHQRHMTGDFIKKVANMSCTTCHQGNDPREETGHGVADEIAGLTMRKMVDPNTCLMCHGQHNAPVMGLPPGSWVETGAAFQNNCLLCHAAIRTSRHHVNFLKADVIEKEGAATSDTCFGCHGGRAWYRIVYPYPRHPWPGGSTVPDWAKDRPTESDLRFLIQNPNNSANQQAAAAPAAQQAQ